MFAPTKTWRRWHRRININQRRYAVVSAIAATGVPALVMSKGHLVQEAKEFPLVVSDKVQGYGKTKEAVTFLKRVKAWKDVEKVYKSRRMRAGVGKMRNRRRVQRRGPLIVYGKDQGLTKAFRNIPGVTTISVLKLSLLELAPGGHVGRFVIWTESAFALLDKLYGTWRKGSELKKGYNLPMTKMANADLGRLLKSEEIQSVVRAPIKHHVTARIKSNPLVNQRAMKKLNPFAIVTKRVALLRGEKKTDAAVKRTLERRKAMVAKAKATLMARKVEGRLKLRLDKFQKRREKKKQQRKEKNVVQKK